MAIIPEKYTTLSPLQEEYRKFWQRFNELSLIHSEFSSTFKVHLIQSDVTKILPLASHTICF